MPVANQPGLSPDMRRAIRVVSEVRDAAEAATSNPTHQRLVIDTETGTVRQALASDVEAARLESRYGGFSGRFRKARFAKTSGNNNAQTRRAFVAALNVIARETKCTSHDMSTARRALLSNAPVDLKAQDAKALADHALKSIETSRFGAALTHMRKSSRENGIQNPPTVSQYIARCNAHCTAVSHDKAIKSMLRDALKESFSKTARSSDQKMRHSLHLKLTALNEEQQLIVSRALATGDGRKIKAAFIEVGLADGSNPEWNNLVHLAEHARSADKKPLNATVAKLMKFMTENGPNGRRTFEEKCEFNRKLMRGIPDYELHPRMKRHILNQLYPQTLKSSRSRFEKIFRYADKSVTEGVTNVTYEASVAAPRTRPSFSELEKRNAARNYLAALAKPGLNASEFILLTYGLFKATNRDPDELKTLANRYARQEYEGCMAIIHRVADQNNALDAAFDNPVTLKAAAARMGNRQPESVSGGMLIQAMARHVRPVSGQDDNNAKRYFETRAAQHHLSRTSDGGINVAAVSRILGSQSGLAVRTPEDAEEGILTWSDQEKNTVGANMIRYGIRRKLSGYDSVKDRSWKPDALSPKDLSLRDRPSNHITSGNSGILLQRSPNFRDEISETPMINRGPDGTTHSGKEGMYPHDNPRTPFTGSLSGHMVFVAGRLKKYISENKNSPTLQQDVSAMMQGIISTYVKHGYHSEHEIRDMFAFEAMRKTFVSAGIDFDFDRDDRVLEDAMLDASKYVSTFARKDAMMAHLKSETPQVPAIDEIA